MTGTMWLWYSGLRVLERGSGWSWGLLMNRYILHTAHCTLYTVHCTLHTAQCTQVKSAYRRLSKKVHPDKNKAEGATEAFKKLSVAYKSLIEGGGGGGEEGVDVDNGFNGFNRWPWEQWEEEEGEEGKEENVGEEERRRSRETWADWVKGQEKEQRGRRRKDELKFLVTCSLLLLLFSLLAVTVFPGTRKGHTSR